MGAGGTHLPAEAPLGSCCGASTQLYHSLHYTIICIPRIEEELSRVVVNAGEFEKVVGFQPKQGRREVLGRVLGGRNDWSVVPGLRVVPKQAAAGLSKVAALGVIEKILQLQIGKAGLARLIGFRPSHEPLCDGHRVVCRSTRFTIPFHVILTTYSGRRQCQRVLWAKGALLRPHATTE